MSLEDPRDLATRYHLKVVQDGDVQALDQLVGEPCLVSDNNWTVRGPLALKDAVAELRLAFPDMVLEIDAVEATAAGGAVSRWHADATHLGEFKGLAPTNLPVSYWGISWFTVRDDRIVGIATVSTLQDALQVLRDASRPG